MYGLLLALEYFQAVIQGTAPAGNAAVQARSNATALPWNVFRRQRQRIAWNRNDAAGMHNQMISAALDLIKLRLAVVFLGDVAVFLPDAEIVDRKHTDATDSAHALCIQGGGHAGGIVTNRNQRRAAV